MNPLCLIAALFLSVVASPDPLRDNERVRFADGLYSRGMYELAAAEYEAYLRDFPKGEQAAVAHFRLGESYRRLDRKLDAEKQFRLVFTGYPESEFRHRAGFKRAGIFMDVGRYPAAAQLFREVIKGNPPGDMTSASLYFLGEALIKSEKPREAVAALEQLRQEYSSSEFHDYALLKLASLYSEQMVGADREEGEDERGPADDKMNEVLALYGTVIEKPSSDRVAAEALFQMAGLHFRRGEYVRSAGIYKRLLTEHPSDKRAGEGRLTAAWAAHNAGLYADALRTVGEALKGDVGDAHAEWLYLKANSERQLMKNKTAAATYALLLKRFGESRFANPARYERALTFYKMGKFAETIDEAGKVALTSQLTKDVYWLLAESHAALEQDDAVQYYRLIVKEYPDSDVCRDATYRLARHLQLQGEHKEAARYYHAVAEKFPDSDLTPQAMFAAACCLAAAGMHAEAVRDWGVLIRDHASDSRVEDAVYQKAMSEIRIHRDEDALGSLRELVKRFPGTEFLPDAHYWQGVILKEAGKLQDAEAELLAALESSPRKELERESRYQLGVILHKGGRSDEAADQFRPLLNSPLRAKFGAALLQWFSEYSFSKERYDDAIVSARQLVAGGDGRQVQIGWCLIGRACLAKGEMTEAEKAFRTVLSTDTASRAAAEAALRLGEIMLERDDYDSSDAHFSDAAEMASSKSMLGIRAHSYAGLARTAKARGDLTTAVRYFMSVAILYDDAELVPECLYEAAMAFEKEGKTEERTGVIDELAERYPESEWARLARRMVGPVMPSLTE